MSISKGQCRHTEVATRFSGRLCCALPTPAGWTPAGPAAPWATPPDIQHRFPAAVLIRIGQPDLAAAHQTPHCSRDSLPARRAPSASSAPFSAGRNATLSCRTSARAAAAIAFIRRSGCCRNRDSASTTRTTSDLAGHSVPPRYPAARPARPAHANLTDPCCINLIRFSCERAYSKHHVQTAERATRSPPWPSPNTPNSSIWNSPSRS